MVDKEDEHSIAGHTSSESTTGEGLLADLTPLNCPSLEAPPQDLKAAEEIRKWGCQKLVGDRDQTEKIGTLLMGDKMFSCATEAANKMQYSCWNSDGDQLARFGDLRDGAFQDVTIFDGESASELVDEATLLRRKGDSCTATLKRGETTYSITTRGDSIALATLSIRDDQSRLLKHKVYQTATGEFQTEERREWDGKTFKSFETTDSGEQLVATGDVDEEGRDIRIEQKNNGSIEEFAFDDEGRQILYRMDSDADGKWDMGSTKTYDDEGREVKSVAIKGENDMSTTVFEYGPHGVAKAVMPTEDGEIVVQKVTYDSQGRPVEARRVWPNTMTVTKYAWEEDHRVSATQTDYRLPPATQPVVLHPIDETPDWDKRTQDRAQWFGCFFED